MARKVFPIAGIAFSRLLTRHLRNTPVAQGQKGGPSGHPSPSITYGPCQTPALGFCVARQDTGQDGADGVLETLKSFLELTGFTKKKMSLSIDVP